MAQISGFVVRRLIAMVAVIFIIVSLVFLLAQASPYDPIRSYLAQHSNPATIRLYHHLFGLDLPMWRQYTNYLGRLAHGDFGRAYERDYFGQSVWRDVLQPGVVTTLKLGTWALFLALIVGLPIGLISALKQNSLFDHVGQSFMITLYVIPSFVIIPVCILVFGDELHWLPTAGWGDSGWWGPFGFVPNPGKSVSEMVLPVTIYAAGLAGYFAKSFRSFVLEVMNQDYIRTARAKGLKPSVVIYLHACKNTLVPLASIVGPTVAYLIVGAFIVELFFGIQGIAYVTVTSVENNDFPVIEATTILLAVFVVIVNMLTDIFYAIVDPRVRL